MKYYLLVCEAATGIVLMQDCTTRFQNHGGTTKSPRIEVDSLDAAQHRATGILIMHPGVEVSIYDELENYIKTLPA
ncbi:hypothetical protein LRS06_20050 [Hymenobacter sp. J193]|uniref:hypothetical protein n=1 Tax=Hymenobacter sp. J193 TaxID=2898429 RepID=UPI00215112FF|nr:hypothetical protein [Hymenobacter sp. J193]MCR5890023.1 hypothetical protein [Hymenobacter sp. J193]